MVKYKYSRGFKMRDYMKNYIDELDELIMSQKIDNIDIVIKRHLSKINFYMHERLVHFLVTMLIAILTMITFLYTMSHFSIGFLILTLLFIALLVPYIIHYYFLENGVQYMYRQYDRLMSLKK